MSAQHVQKLEALLQRVQHNRAQARPQSEARPRSDNGFSVSEAATASTTARPEAPAPAAARAAAERPAFKTPAELDAPVIQPPSVQSSPATRTPVEVPAPPAPVARGAARGASPLEMAVEGAASRARPAAAAAASPPPAAAPAEMGAVVADPAPAPPSRAIAQVVSKHPATAEASFGELLRRSLALRPR